MRSLLLLSTSMLVISGAALAETPAPNYSSIWTFGDSLSDTGRTSYSSAATIFWQAPVGKLYDRGRFSNGLVWAENLHKLNVQPLQYSQYHNFAYGGAVVGKMYSKTMSQFVNNVQDQVSFFGKILDHQEICDGWALSCNAETSWWDALANPARTARAKASTPNSGKTSAGRISAADVGAKPLVTFAIGGNNFRQELEDVDAKERNLQTPKNALLSQVPSELRKLNNELAKRSDIAQNGVTYYVATVPNISQTPKLNSYSKDVKDQFSTVIKETNRELKKRLYDLGDEFSAKNAKTRLVVVDFDALLAEAIKSPASFGFVETQLNCVSSKSGEYVNGCSGAKVGEFLFWDEFHPTAKGHEMIARYAHNTDLLENGSNADIIEPYVANIEWRDRAFAGDISGKGSIIKQGESTLTLAGNNSYTGGTRIDKGTVRITSDGNLGNRSGVLILQGGTLQAARNVSVERNVQINESTSYADPIGGSGFGGTFNVDSGVELTLAHNTLSGEGNIRKIGQGVLDIRSTMADGRKFTQVDEGTLAINTSNPYRSDLIVLDEKAFLKGSGTIIGKVEIWGLAQPGNSIGRLDIVGDLVMHETSQYEFEVGTHNADFINVTGNVVMDGDILVDVETNEKVSDQQYPLIGYTGTLSGLDYDSIEVSPFLRASLSQGNQLVSIAFARDFARPATTLNQYSIAGHLNSAFRKEDQGDLDNVFDALDDVGTAPAAARALDVLSGQSVGNVLTANAIQQGQFTRALEDRLAARRAGRDASQDIATPLPSRTDANGLGTALQGAAAAVSRSGTATANTGTASAAPLSSGLSVWARALGGPTDVRGPGAFTMTGFGVLAGVDKEIGNGLIGISLGYGNFSADGDQGGDTDADSYQISLYGSVREDMFFLDGTVGYSYADYKTNRVLAFGDLTRVAHGSSHGNNVSLSLKAGLHFDFSGIVAEPSLGFDWYHLNRGSFSETSAGSAGLNVKSQTMDLVLPSVGVRFSSTHDFGNLSLTPEFAARYYYNAGDRTSDIQASLIGVPMTTPDFVAKSAGLGRNIGVVSAGLSVQSNDNLRFFARYELAVSDDTTANSFSAGLKYTW